MAYLPFLKERSPQHQAFSPFQFVSDRLGLPDPKFKIGDRVQQQYINDDELDENYGELESWTGTIIWMAPDFQKRRWALCILIDGAVTPEPFDVFPNYWDGEDDLYLV